MQLHHLTRRLEQYPRLHEQVMALEGWRLARRLDLLAVRGGEAVIVFQMGKVGSTSVASSFPTGRHPVSVQTHHLHRPRVEAAKEWSRARGLPVRAHFFHADAVARRVVDRGRPFKLITLVREPVGRSVSNFFHNFERFVGVPLTDSTHTTEELVQLLVEHEKQFDESRWFQREFEPALGIDLYAHPFPHDEGVQRLRAGRGERGEVLVLRLETSDDDKEAAIAAFLGETDFRLASANVGAEKDYGAVYERFRSAAVLPEAFLDRKLGSIYATHFYSAAERDEVRRRWSVRE
ncbi:MAG: putative capsular polysaccharide synthesis family protein [Acidimicrobiales bacterium]